MSLSKVREKINQVDDSMKQLFDERMECSNLVADIKLKDADKVFKPVREKEIAERFSGDREYLAFIKLVMQISRKRQYGIFLDNMPTLSQGLSNIKDNISESGELRLSLKSDPSMTEGLPVNDLLTVIASSSLKVKKLSVTEDGSVDAVLSVGAKEQELREALVLAYMLHEESL